jgi:hypothetical protein
MLKNLFVFVMSLIFTKKEEYDFRSPEFNLKKILVVALICFLMLVSGFSSYASYKLAAQVHEVHKTCACGKNQPTASLDSQKPPK